MKRIEWVDFGKGLTIFFVLLVHVIEGVYKTDAFSNYDEFSEITMAIIFTFIMPVFFALSGYLYKSPIDFNHFKNNFVKKLINLFVPYAIFSFIYVVLQHFDSGAHNAYSWNSLLGILVQPIGYLWFLYVLFFVFLCVDLLTLLRIPKYLQLFIYFLLFVLVQFINLPYSLSGTFSWVFCFYLGFVFKEILSKIDKRISLYFLFLIFVTVIYYQSLTGGNWFETNIINGSNFVTKIISIPIAFFIFKNFTSNKFFRYFQYYGKYSLIIYLVHAPVASIIRVLLMKLGVTNYILLILMIAVVTWGVSVFVCYLSKNIKVISMVFYPVKNLSFLLKK